MNKITGLIVGGILLLIVGGVVLKMLVFPSADEPTNITNPKNYMEMQDDSLKMLSLKTPARDICARILTLVGNWKESGLHWVNDVNRQST